MPETKKVQMVREQMLNIYGEVCWMGYRLTRKNVYTYHHIIEAREGGPTSIENGAILTRRAHSDLNTMEKSAINLYRELNWLFKELNDTRKPPTKEYFKEVNGILLIASKIVKLNSLWEPNPDFEMLVDIAQATHETYPEVIIPKKYLQDWEEAEVIEIPGYYRDKMKHKNRNKKSYKYN